MTIKIVLKKISWHLIVHITAITIGAAVGASYWSRSQPASGEVQCHKSTPSTHVDKSKKLKKLKRGSKCHCKRFKREPELRS
jgi:hypothetical protein